MNGVVAWSRRSSGRTLADMTGKYSWKSVAKTAKKWIDAKTTEATTADRRTRRQADAAEHQHERELTAEATGAALTTLIPGLGRAIERQEAHRLRAESEAREADYLRRSEAVLAGASVSAWGAVNGEARDLAVTVTRDEQEGTVLVLLETVDAVHFDRAELSAAGFALSGFTGDGTYLLSDDIPSLDPGSHHIVFDNGDSDVDWYYWTADLGPAQAVVSNGVADVTMQCRNAASQEVTVSIRVPLG